MSFLPAFWKNMKKFLITQFFILLITGQWITCADKTVQKRHQKENRDSSLSMNESFTLYLTDISKCIDMFNDNSDHNYKILRNCINKKNTNEDNIFHYISLATEKDPNATKRFCQHKDTQTFINQQNIWKETPLHSACLGGKKNGVKLLLEHGAIRSINIQDAGGNTPLHIICCKNSSKDIAQLLMINGASNSLNIMDREGYTSFFYAVARGDKDFIQFLFTFKPDISIKCNGNTILHILTYNSSLSVPQFQDIFELFIEKGADTFINEKNSCGNTPLHLLSRKIDKDTTEKIQFLIKKGAKYDIFNNKDQTPLHIATDLKNLPVIQFFLEKMAPLPDNILETYPELLNIFDNNYSLPSHFPSLQNLCCKALLKTTIPTEENCHSTAINKNLFIAFNKKSYYNCIIAYLSTTYHSSLQGAEILLEKIHNFKINKKYLEEYKEKYKMDIEYFKTFSMDLQLYINEYLDKLPPHAKKDIKTHAEKSRQESFFRQFSELEST